MGGFFMSKIYFTKRLTLPYILPIFIG
jgi:hypothetical protein